MNTPEKISLTFDKPTLVTLTAPTCSGKNYLLTALEHYFGFQRLVSTTTRASRTGEVNGIDYHFISKQKSIELEAAGKFAELVTFRGERYGVTHEEMQKKMSGQACPIVILEPQGLDLYKKLCIDNGWDSFSIYIHATDNLKLSRLAHRTADELSAIAMNLADTSEVVSAEDRLSLSLRYLAAVCGHTDRVLSITGDERRWSQKMMWDCIVPGDDLLKALDYIKRGVEYRNKKVAEPKPYQP